MGFLINLVSNNPIVLLIGAGIVAFVLYQKYATRLRIRVPGSHLKPEDIVGKILGPRFAEAKMEREAAKYKKQENYLAAGKILEDMGKLQQAAEMYSQGSEFWAAASTFERLGNRERAAELYLQAGDYKKAAAVFIEIGKHAKAAALFLEKGNTLEAARLYGLANQWDKAGELYSKSGYPLRAAEAYEKIGEFLKGAEAYEKHFMENVSFSTTYSSTAVSADQKSSLLAGRLYRKAGDPNRALQVFVKGSYFKDAADVSMELSQFAKAAEYYMRAEDSESAALAFERAGDTVRAATLRGEVAFKSDRMAEAAAYFKQGQDYLRSAELFESVGKLAEAAGAYEAGESYAAAGGVYIRAGLKDRAASSFERAQDYETAAKLYEEVGNNRKAIELYERAGLTFKSGESAAKAGERDKAIALLQRVSQTDENYRPATEVLCRLFVEGGMPALAVDRVQKVLAGQPASAANLDLYYWLAVALEASGSPAEALAAYKKIQSEDLQFRDVNQRAGRLQSGGAVAAPPRPAAPSGAGPARPQATTTAAAPAAKAQRFVSREEVGRGPLGVVHRAEDQVDGRNVALRSLPPELIAGPGVMQALVADLKAAATLSHPGVVKVLGLVEVSGQRCVVTEYVAGRNFSEALRAGHKMSFQQVHNVGRVLAQALAFVHGKGAVHGSIQPSNIMVAGGVLKIADLGLGRLAHALPPDKGYRAPEGRLDAHGDLYAMAGVLYHLVTGVHPRTQPQGTGLPLPSTLAPGVPETFDKLLLRALHPRQELRYAAAEEMLAELKGMVHFG
jgi:tetratricopeptide (TPR) repeat protein